MIQKASTTMHWLRIYNMILTHLKCNLIPDAKCFHYKDFSFSTLPFFHLKPDPLCSHSHLSHVHLWNLIYPSHGDGCVPALGSPFYLDSLWAADCSMAIHHFAANNNLWVCTYHGCCSVSGLPHWGWPLLAPSISL